MNVSTILKKAPIVCLLFLCIVISLNTAEAGRSIQLRKIKAPRHISISARSGNGMYARTYAYGRPIPSYSTKEKNRRYHTGRRRNGRRDNHSKTYASRYKNWSHSPRSDRIGQPKKRKELLPFLTEPPYGANKHKRRIRPQRPNSMQRPKPPKKPNEFDDEYFFPEEAKRAETKYEFENRYPRPKKKRRPDFESIYKYENPKIPFYDEKPLGFKTKSRPSFSYSSFIQHTPDESEDLYEETDNIYSQPVVRNKKKRVKKKSNSRKKHKEKFKPFVFENDQAVDNYPPYITPDDYELPSKTYKKRNKPNYDNDDDEFLPSQIYKPRPQINTLFSTDSDYKSTQQTQQIQFNPTYSQTWSQSAVETTARPVTYQTENGFQPQYIPDQYNYNKDYTTLQKIKTVTTNTQSTYYSQPDNNFKTPYNNYASGGQASTQSQTPNFNTFKGNYNQPSPTYSQPSPSYSQPSPSYSQPSPTYSQPLPTYSQSSSTYSKPSPTYSQPLPSSSSILTDVTIQKSVPIYDNTETFYNFNNNAYVNSQSSKYYNSDSNSSKYYDQDSSQKYGTRLSNSAVSSYSNKHGEKTDSDSEFIKKHQNLYNNGLSGVPIQGDGYAKESAKKDYDIGYGDFQFDENPSS